MVTLWLVPAASSVFPGMHDGARLAGQTRWLLLLLAHLTGRRVRARVELEDLVQEVFLRALTAPAGLPDSEQALRGLLARIARHCVIDVLRAMRAAKRGGHEVRLQRSDWSRTGSVGGLLEASGAGPATLAAQAEQERALMEAFESLSAEHRRVVGLRQFEGLSAAESGRRMGRSESAIHSLYRRALQAWGVAGRS